MVDWIAGVLELIALVVIGNKSRWGFAVMFTAGAFWISYVALNENCLGLLVVVPLAMLINVRNFIKWSGDSTTKEG